MPASSVYSTSGGSRATDLAATVARDIANREVALGLRAGTIDPGDQALVNSVYSRIYQQEYYKYYNLIHLPVESIIDNPSPNKKFHLKHTVVRFSKTNQIILVNRNTITVGKFDYPIDDRDLSPESAEAYLSLWPGPLDQFDAQLKDKISNYISTLCQQDSQRRIKYFNNVDGQRKVILNILTELLNRNGRIDGPGFTKILLDSHQYQFRSDDEPLDIIEKVLLLGKRVEAAREAQSSNLWAHAMFLSYIDDPQPTKNVSFSPTRDGFFARVLEEFTKTIDNKTLKIVYRSLLNRIIQTESVKPRVDNDEHMFAILNANDCEMDFDQSNETFKLIIASRGNASRNHIIKLGFPNLDSYDPRDDISNRSHTSFLQGDTYTSRTLTITNIDMLILNEIWEYCINLALGTCNSSTYIINLIPYKLVFAARLLDYGSHEMFASYLNSLRNAIDQMVCYPNEFKDPFYDWEAIKGCVNYLEKVWELYKGGPDHSQSFMPQMESVPESKTTIPQLATTTMDFNPQPVLDTPQPDYQSLPYSYDYTPRPSFHQDVSDFSPELIQPEDPPQPPAEQINPMETLFHSPPPIDELDVSRNSTANVRPSPIEPLSPPSADELDISSTSAGRNSSQQQTVNNSHLSQTLNNIIRGIMPRSNSREMKLPDDSLRPSWKKDDWRDNSGSNENRTDGFDAPPPPPVMDSSILNQANNQSWKKSTKFRYPQP